MSHMFELSYSDDCSTNTCVRHSHFQWWAVNMTLSVWITEQLCTATALQVWSSRVARGLVREEVSQTQLCPGHLPVSGRSASGLLLHNTTLSFCLPGKETTFCPADVQWKLMWQDPRPTFSCLSSHPNHLYPSTVSLLSLYLCSSWDLPPFNLSNFKAGFCLASVVVS